MDSYYTTTILSFKHLFIHSANCQSFSICHVSNMCQTLWQHRRYSDQHNMASVHKKFTFQWRIISAFQVFFLSHLFMFLFLFTFLFQEKLPPLDFFLILLFSPLLLRKFSVLFLYFEQLTKGFQHVFLSLVLIFYKGLSEPVNFKHSPLLTDMLWLSCVLVIIFNSVRLSYYCFMQGLQTESLSFCLKHILLNFFD